MPAKPSRVVTFDGAPPPGTINFGVGQPSADLLPVDLIRRAAADFLDGAQPLELNYGERQGEVGFREALAGFLTEGYGSPVSADSLFVSGGNSQALDFVCAQFARQGDLVFIEEPSYFLAHRIFADHGLQAVGVPVDGDGLRIDALEAELARHRPALLYTIPSFHNPGGHSLSAARRRKLVELSEKHGFVVVADEVYQLLHYFEEPPPALATMIDAGHVLSLGSFSKIMTPGLRLGWIQAAAPLMQRLLATGVVNSGGSLSHFSSQVMRHALELGLQKQNLEQVRSEYRRRVEAMDSALHRELGRFARWQRPAGGYFFWLECRPGIDTTALWEKAPRYETGFQPGENFSCGTNFRNCLRLSFAHYGCDEIREGVRRLGALFRDHAST